MMTLLFLSLAVIIAIVVILVSAKFIKAGFDARSEIRDQKQSENLNQEVQDITNENIEESNEQVKIINQIDDLILIVDKFKNIKFFNNSAKKKFGEARSYFIESS
jgi:predicted PurR-regulated permease PerM